MHAVTVLSPALSTAGGIMFICCLSVHVCVCLSVRLSVRDLVSLISVMCIDGTKLLSLVHFGTKMN